MSLRDYNTRRIWAGLAILAGIGLTLAGLILPDRAAHASRLLQASATSTPTVTPSPTGSLTPGTVTVSATMTGTLTVSPSPTGPTATPTLTFTPSPSPPQVSPTAFQLSPSPTVDTSALITPSPTPGPTLHVAPTVPPPTFTPTLLPLPQVTFQYPEREPTQELLAREANGPGGDLPKGSSFSQSVRGFFRRLGSFAPLLFIAGVWLVLGAWFVISQIIIHRK